MKLLCLVRYIFALNMFELGCINSTEWAVYQDWHSLLVEQFGHQVELEGIIYLRAPPKVCEMSRNLQTIQEIWPHVCSTSYFSSIYPYNIGHWCLCP